MSATASERCYMPIDKIGLKPVGYILRRPVKSRKTFQIQPYAKADGKKVYLPHIEHEALSALNRRFLSKEITMDEAVLHLKNTLIPMLRKKSKIPERLEINNAISEQNIKVFRELWDADYRRRRMEDHGTAKVDFMRALRTLEPLSIVTTDIDTLQRHWDKAFSGTKHKRYGHRINQMLKFLRRDYRLNLDKAMKAPPIWVNYKELKLILTHVEDPTLRDLYEFLWGTGCRLGEAFPLEVSELNDNYTIFICKQMTPRLKIKPDKKNKVDHHTMVLKEAREAAKRWLAVEDKASYRKRCQHPLTAAALKAFPADKKKQISPHKLRHSYVRYLTERGIGLDKVKDLIGDSLSTTEQVYAGWVIANSEIDHIEALLEVANKRINKR